MWPLENRGLPAIREKRAQRIRALATAPSEVADAQHMFLKASASDIVAHTERGEWTASQVLEAFIARAAYAHRKTNCLTEIMFDYGRRQAKELDKEFDVTKKLRGPLHGVPVSIKDLFEIEGFDVSMGLSARIGQPCTKNADIVNQLLKAGAIIYVKTNVPQLLLVFECCNPVFGRTTNPWSDKYTCGGSSGGEGSLLAMDGSVLGIASDIGGSIRIPASYCGIYSLKPSSDRMSPAGARSACPGYECIKLAIGPMARTVSDLELLCRVSFGVQGDQLIVAPVAYRDVQLPSKLRFGYYTSDNYVKASPANKRAVMETVEALRREGHECIEFEVPEAEVAFNIFAGLLSADGYESWFSALGPDAKEKTLFIQSLGSKIPSLLWRFASWTVETCFGDKIFAGSMRATSRKSVKEVYEWIDCRNQFTSRFYSKVWDHHSFDGIIAPVQAIPQMPHGGCRTFSPVSSGTILYNVLDHPSGCIPVTRVDAEKDVITEEWIKESGHGSAILEAGLFIASNPLYKPAELAGMPVGIQISGRRWDDEKVIGMMHVIDKALGERGFGPGAWDAYMKTRN